MSSASKSTAIPRNGSTADPDTIRTSWSGIVALETNPIPSGVEGSALYSELWSKMRWVLGTTFGMRYGKRSVWTGELSRRLTLLVLANRPDK